jgi:O-antigen ligase
VLTIATAGQQRAGVTESRWRALLRAFSIALPLFVYTSLGFPRHLPPLSLFIHLVVFFALFVWALVHLVRGRGLPRSPLTLPLIACLGAAVIGTAASVDPRVSLDGALTVVALVGLFFLFCDLLVSGWNEEDLVAGLLCFAGLLLFQGLLVTISWHLGWYEARVSEYPLLPVRFRLFGVADWPTQLAGLVNLALSFAILRLARARTAPARVIWIGWLLAAGLVIFFASSRSGWLASVLVVGVTFAWLLLQDGLPGLRQRVRWLWRRKGILGAVLLGLFLLAALFFVTRRASPSEFTRNAGGTFASRDVFWRVAWDDFVAHPIAGSGPLTYAGIFVERFPADPRDGYVAPHGHNLFLNTLAEQGLLGLAALLAVIVALAVCVARGFVSSIKSQGAGGRRTQELLLAAFASLAGYFLFYQVDLPSWLPSSSVAALLVCAVAVSASGTLRPGAPASRAVLAGILVAGCAVFAFLFPANSANQALIAGVRHAIAGDWGAAAHSLDGAVLLDPRFEFYQEQRGYAYGVAATSGDAVDPDMLSTAIESYSRALTSASRWAPDLVNAAWLLKVSGDAAQSEEWLTQAAQKPDAGPLAGMLLGDLYARTGRTAAAADLYHAVLHRYPWAAESAGCRSGPICRKVAGSLAASPDPATAFYAGAMGMLESGRPRQALELLSQESYRSSSPTPWILRANAHLALGELAQAEYATKVAAALGAGDIPIVATIYATTSARIYLGRGNPAAAIAALEAVTRPELRVAPYHNVQYRRQDLPGLYLPPVDMLRRTNADLDAYALLAAAYRSQGREAGASWAESQARVLAGLLQ